MDALLPLHLAIMGPSGWAVLLLLVVLLFGAAKIPQLARSLGQAKREFERGSREALPAEPPAEDEAKVHEAAKAMGIPTEGRSLADIKRDIQTRLS